MVEKGPRPAVMGDFVNYSSLPYCDMHACRYVIKEMVSPPRDWIVRILYSTKIAWGCDNTGEVVPSADQLQHHTHARSSIAFCYNQNVRCGVSIGCVYHRPSLNQR